MQELVHKNRMTIYLIAAAAVFIGLAVYGYYAFDNYGHFQRPAAMNQQQFVTDMTYYDLPRMTLAIGQGNEETHVRVDITLEVAKKDLPLLEGFQPKITDKLNMFLIAQHPELLRRFSFLPTLRGELLEQVNNVGAPVPVHDLMLRQMVIM